MIEIRSVVVWGGSLESAVKGQVGTIWNDENVLYFVEVVVI